MLVGRLHAKHCSREHGRNDTFDINMFFWNKIIALALLVGGIVLMVIVADL